ncbi:MAG: CoA-binding protein [Bacteroidota bacterium]
MNTLQDIQDFLASKKMAVAGVSRDKKKFGYSVFSHLKQHGFEIAPINPNTSEIDGTPCFTSVKDLPEGTENLLVLTPKSKTLEVLSEAEQKGIKRIWIQQMSETPEVMEFTKGKDYSVISKKCIYMFSEPVSGIHRFHRGITKLFGQYPK